MNEEPLPSPAWSKAERALRHRRLPLPNLQSRLRRQGTMNLQTQRRLGFLTEVTGIFEKEILILLYYLVFSAIAGAFPESLVQAIFFIAGTAFQVWLKIARKGGLWRHYTLLGFYLTGTLVNHGKNTLGNGLLVFLFIVSTLSLLYELYRGRVKRPVLATVMGMAHSAVVFTAFPLLYSLFLLNKKGISLASFFNEQEHFLVFLGYSTFYLSVVINKQLLSVQNSLLRKGCSPIQDETRPGGVSKAPRDP